MKNLTLIRHAKSSWDDPALEDFHRPLSSRGERDLPAMAQRVRDFGLVPDRLLTSSSNRTLATTEALICALRLSRGQVLELPELYGASCDSLLQQLRQQDGRLYHLMVVGHNPGLKNLGEFLSGERLPRFPTAAVLHLRLEVTCWSQLTEAGGAIELFDYPKLHL